MYEVRTDEDMATAVLKVACGQLKRAHAKLHANATPPDAAGVAYVLAGWVTGGAVAEADAEKAAALVPELRKDFADARRRADEERHDRMRRQRELGERLAAIAAA
jgi:hypothetical protein